MTTAGEVYYADDGTVSTVLDDVYDPSYEPTEQEIEEYAKFLGVDPDTEPELLWLGRSGLKEPMPKEWKPCKTDTGDVYYFNFETGESIWDHPMDEVFKARVESERARLKREGKANYKPPADAVAKKGAVAKGAAGKKKAAAAESKSDKKLNEVEAKFSGGATTTNSFATPLTSLTTASKVPLATTKLNALGSGPSALATAGGGSVGALKSLTTGGLPSAFGATSGGLGGGNKLGSSLSAPIGGGGGGVGAGAAAGGVNAAKETEKRIRERLGPEFQAKLDAMERRHEQETEELSEELAAKLKKIEKDLSAQIDDEKDTAKRAADRQNKRELQEHEEALERQRDQLRKDLRLAKDAVTEAELTAHHSSRNAEKEVAAKVEELRKSNEAEITRRRLEIHDAWRKEKDAADAKAQSEVDSIMSNFESEKKAAEAKETLLFSKKLEEDESDLQSELQALKTRLAAQRRDALEAIAADAAATGHAHSAAYTAAEKAYEDAIQTATASVDAKYAAERQRHQSEMAALRTAHTASLHDAAAEAAMKQSEGAATALRAAKAEADEAVSAVERELRAEREAELERIDEETRRLELNARAAASSQLEGAAAAIAAKISRARDEAVAEAQSRIAALKAKHQRELAALEEEVGDAEAIARRNGGGGGSASSSPADALQVDAAFSRLKQQWLAANPSPALPPLPSLPPAMQSSDFDTGLSDAHKAEIYAAVQLEKHRLKAEGDRKVAALQLQLDEESKGATAEARQRAEMDHRRQIDAFKSRLAAELKAENDALLQRLTAANSVSAAAKSSSDATIRASRRESRQIAKMLRRKQMRDSLEANHRLEQTQRDVEISRLVDEEQRRLQRQLEALTAQLAAAAAASSSSMVTPPIPALVDSRPVTPERQVNHRPPLAPTGGSSSAPFGSNVNSAMVMGMGVNPSASSLMHSPVQMVPVSLSASGNNFHMLSSSEHNTPNRNINVAGGGGYHHQQHNLSGSLNANSNGNMMLSNVGIPPIALDFGGGGAGIPPMVSARRSGGGAQQQQGSGGGSIGERLAKARDVLRKKKKDIKARQEQLENARADWRIDVAAAKHNKDGGAVEVLMKIKKQMEKVAHQLNDETRDLLSAVEWLKEQEEAEGRRRAAGAMYAGSSANPNSNAPNPSSSKFADPMAMMMGGGGGGHQQQQQQPDINQVLAALAAQTMSIEQRLNNQQQQQGGGGHHHHHNHHHQQQQSDPVTNKWSNWLAQQQHGSNSGSPVKGGAGHPATRPSSSAAFVENTNVGGGNHLNAWLQDQLMY